jgi:hypothetical protein
VTKKPPPSWSDKTPTEAVRLKSPSALNLLDLATAVARQARRYVRAEEERDDRTRAAVGPQLVRLARELGAFGFGITQEGKRRAS